MMSAAKKVQFPEKAPIERLADMLTNPDLLAAVPYQDVLQAIELSPEEAIVVWHKSNDLPGTIRIMYYRDRKDYLNDAGHGLIINSIWDSKCTYCKNSEDYQTKSGVIVKICRCDRYSSREILERRVK